MLRDHSRKLPDVSERTSPGAIREVTAPDGQLRENPKSMLPVWFNDVRKLCSLETLNLLRHANPFENMTVDPYSEICTHVHTKHCTITGLCRPSITHPRTVKGSRSQVRKLVLEECHLVPQCG